MATYTGVQFFRGHGVESVVPALERVAEGVEAVHGPTFIDTEIN